MNICGIVSEFNPFHRGHEYLISKAKDMGAQRVACVMSGSSTQRGELALTDKYLRAGAAVGGGADLVLELPFPFCSASAQVFADGAIYILSQICDTVIFGSECGDIGLLSRCADYSYTDSFKREFALRLEAGEQSAAAYASLIHEGVGITLSSNDLLGVEYIKAAKRLGVEDRISFLTVERLGSPYLSEEGADNGGFDSAMALRRMLEHGENEKTLEGRLPEKSYDLLMSAVCSGEITDGTKLCDAARLFFRMCEPSDISSFAECEGGVAERICKMAHESADAEEFYEMLKTKRYTDAKLRRAMLFAMCKVRREDLFSLPSYTCLLAANACGRSILSAYGKRENKPFEIVTKPADASCLDSAEAARQWELSKKIEALYTFSLKKSAPTGQSVRKKPYIT